MIVHSILCTLVFIQDDSWSAFMLLCAALKGRTELVQKLVRDDNKVITLILHTFSYTCIVHAIIVKSP